MKNIVGDTVTLVSLVMVVVGVMIAAQNPPSFLKALQFASATQVRSVYTSLPTAAATLQIAVATRAPTADPPTQALTTTRQPTAQPTPPPPPSASQTTAPPERPTADSSALQVFGPAQGTVQRDREQSCSDVALGNFAAQVEFTNPNDAPEIPNAGYGFEYYRDHGSYQTWVNWSDGLLQHVAHVESGPTAEARYLAGLDFRYSGMNKGKGAVNQVKIQVKGNKAQLVVNDIPGPMLDLPLEDSRSPHTTKVCLCLCNFVSKGVMQFFGMKIDQITDQAMFRNFTVKSLP